MGEVINSPSYLQSRRETLIKMLEDPRLTATVGYYVPETDETKHFQLSTEQVQDLVTNCILPDLEESTILNYYMDNEEYYRDVYTWTVALSVETEPYIYQYASFSVPADAVRCVQWIQNNLGLTPQSYTEANAHTG
jgi:hypothetical protein